MTAEDHVALVGKPRTTMPKASDLVKVRSVLYKSGLHTVCKEAACPNQAECASQGCAVFLILGRLCTRNCRFCAVDHGEPTKPDPDEALKISHIISHFGIRHAVITSVSRDDLVDGGASAFAQVIAEIKKLSGVTVEVLIPDFQGDVTALRNVLRAGPDVLNHNIETVPGLYPILRSGFLYRRSLDILTRTVTEFPEIPTKTGLMVGLGEQRAELAEVFRDLAVAGCVALTIGQYLQPTSNHHPVERFYSQSEFDELRHLAFGAGVPFVESGPYIRSSYHAAALVGSMQKWMKTNRFSRSIHK